MNRARAIVFALAFYLGTTVFALGIGVIVWLLLPRAAVAAVRLWARAMLAAATVILGIKVRVSGREHLPAGPALIASQHRSAFDTLIWFMLVPMPSYVMKRELIRIPVFGQVARAAGMIAVDRAGGSGAMRALLAAVRAAIAADRQVVIFPEGTRVRAGQHVAPQPGIVALATATGLPVIPVATDSGRCWGRGLFDKHAGTIHIAIGPPIPPGLRREALLGALTTAWEGLEPGLSAPADAGDPCG